MSTTRRSMASRLAAGGAAIAMLLIATLTISWTGEQGHAQTRAQLLDAATLAENARRAETILVRARLAARTPEPAPAVDHLGELALLLERLPDAPTPATEELVSSARATVQTLLAPQPATTAAGTTSSKDAELERLAGIFALLADEVAAHRAEVAERADRRQARTKAALTLVTVLEVAVGAAMVQALLRDLRARTRHLRLLHDQAHEDPLTGLPNRRQWDTAVVEAFQRARVSGRPLTAVILDLDHFKRFNDVHGHLAGDQLLREVAQLFRHALREQDLVARLGGEEFAVLLESSTAGDAEAILTRLRAGMPQRQTFSAGIAQWTGNETPAELLRRADDALYRAKASGRDRWEVAAADAPPTLRLVPRPDEGLVEVG